MRYVTPVSYRPLRKTRFESMRDVSTSDGMRRQTRRALAGDVIVNRGFAFRTRTVVRASIPEHTWACPLVYVFPDGRLRDSAIFRGEEWLPIVLVSNVVPIDVDVVL